jgi:hypothetical protein
LSTVRNPDKSLAQLFADSGVRLTDVARHSGLTVAAVSRQLRRHTRQSTRIKTSRAIAAARAERDPLAKSAAEWLKGEIAAGRLSKKPTVEEMRLVANIVRTTTLDGASKKNGR